GDQELQLLRTSGLYFLMPGKLFDAGSEGYVMERLPGGALKFVRMVRTTAGDQVSIQAEEIQIGRATHAGTRTLKLVHGEPLCSDEASPAGKACGVPVSEQIVLKKAAA